jgi:hypothetical protein
MDYVVKLPTHPKTVKDLRLIRFWLREIFQVHFTSAETGHPFSSFLNPALVEALFPNEDIFLSLGTFTVTRILQRKFPYYVLQNFLLPSIAALTRIYRLRGDLYLSDGIKTLFNELFLTNKHGIYLMDYLSESVDIGDVIKVA